MPGRPREFEDRVESTLRLPRPLHDRLKRYLGGKPANPLIERLITDHLEAEEKAAVADGGVTGPFDWGKR